MSNRVTKIQGLLKLRTKVTVTIGNFVVFFQLVRLIRLSIRFLTIKPRFRYCFLSHKRHRLKLASRYGSFGNYAPCGLPPQMYHMPAILKNTPSLPKGMTVIRLLFIDRTRPLAILRLDEWKGPYSVDHPPFSLWYPTLQDRKMPSTTQLRLYHL